MMSAILSLGSVALVAALILGWASRKFAVVVDKRETEIVAILPGANCGACGFAGCASYAAAIVAGQAALNRCCLGGNDMIVRIAEVMHMDAHPPLPQKALVLCRGDNRATTLKYRYLGLRDCNAAELLADGPKQCPDGCLGLGSCAATCPFGAIEITADELAVVHHERCVGCGRCAAACPRQVIALVPITAMVHVLCRSHDKGAQVRRYCDNGCLGCGLCKKAVPEAYVVERFLARVDYDHAEQAAQAVPVCPNHCIIDLAAQQSETTEAHTSL